MKSPNDEAFDADLSFLDVPADGDPLALFESESGSSQAGDSLRGGSSEDLPPGAGLVRVRRRPIGLNQVLHRLGSVAWLEAVAIVDALCTVLTASGNPRIPEMSRIGITAAGTVVVGAGGDKHAGPALARMLHTLAATGSPPAPLRLFVTRWASAGEEHSIAEFATELAYFARPDGQLLIQAVYERAIATAPIPLRPQVESPRPRQAPPSMRRPQRSSARGLYGIAAAVIVAGIALTTLLAWNGVLSPGRQSSPASPTTPADAEGQAQQLSSTDGGANAATGTPGTGGASSGPRAPAAAPPPPNRPARAAQAASPPAAARPPASGATGAPAPVSSAVRASLAASAAASPRSVPAQPATAGPSASRAVGLSPPRAARRDGPPTGPPIYSRSDPDVTPPVFHHPQLPAQLLSGLQPDMNTIELIVSETGTVERVRLLSTPKRMADMMLLSGAKNWEFEPAVKDGQAVRYRLELSWAATP